MYGSSDQGLCLVVFIHRKRVLVVHYSLGFTAYKAVSGGVFFRCGTPKDAVFKDYKAKPLVQRSVHPRILQFGLASLNERKIYFSLNNYVINCPPIFIDIKLV